MASASFDYAGVSKVTAGAVGEPGKRAFFLQVRAGSALMTLAVEKEQLRVLAARLEEVFATVTVPLAGPMPDMGLEEPLQPAWRVGLVTLAFDEARNDFDISLVELVEEGDDPAHRALPGKHQPDAGAGQTRDRPGRCRPAPLPDVRRAR